MTLSRIGKTHSEETKQKIGIAHQNKNVSVKTREKISKSSKYRNISDTNKITIQKALDVLNLTELPMYIVFSIDKRNNRNVEIIQVKVPKKPNRKFGIKDMPLYEKIKLAIDYKNSII